VDRRDWVRELVGSHLSARCLPGYNALVTSLRRLGLLSLFEIYECLKAADYETWQRNRRHVRTFVSDGFQIPPLKLRLKVAGTADLHAFFHGGKLAAAGIRDNLARHGVEMQRLNGILDFGCGCGRVLRHWSELKGVCGADYQPDLVEWSQANLPFATVCRNGLEPPLPYAGNQFDCAYALSVFTHLSEPLQRAWIRDLVRVLRPGGYLFLSTHGEYYGTALNGQDKIRFQSGQPVIRFAEVSGSNLCNVIHPPEYVINSLGAGLELIEFLPEGASGNPRQDLFLFRK
jgi:SAM-dependent methyltransferase